MKYEVVALLPMKTHSERVPGKNFRDFAGKPLYRWMLDTLLGIPQIELIVINTDARARLDSDPTFDDPRVLIRDRRAEICGDFISMNRIIDDDMGSVTARIYLMTHTTNPLLSKPSICSALSTFAAESAAERCDSLFTVTRVQTRFYRADGSAINHDPTQLLRTQDLEPWFEENSNLYIFTAQSFATTGARIGARPFLFETPKPESVDLDTPEDWEIAEAIASRRQRSRA